ncbi:MAG: M23 family metallopeptidase [Polyangiaceae bacterium]|jgi:murein DD-endopeptidase MepM/ murein hydrolase activator NlpD
MFPLALAAHATSAPCPSGAFPDGDDAVCVGFGDETDGPAAEISVNAHRDVHGRWTVYDEIPRRPERPAAYDAYRYPVPCGPGCIFSGYDLDHPDALQRRGPRLRYVGHGAIDLAEARGTPVQAILLEHDSGRIRVVYAGPLFGTSVVTNHTLREGGDLRDYIVIFGHLDAASAEATPGAIIKNGTVIGFVGDSGSPGLVHLHLEVRRVRSGFDVDELARAPERLIDAAATVVCDPRNVLPLR